MSDNIKVLPNVERDEEQADLEAYKRGLSVRIEYAKLTSSLRFARYQANLEAGFSPEQAFELCTLEDD